MIYYLFVNHDVFYIQESGKLFAIQEGTEEDMNGNSGPIRFVKWKVKVTFADDAQVYRSVSTPFLEYCCFTIIFRPEKLSKFRL